MKRSPDQKNITVRSICSKIFVSLALMASTMPFAASALATSDFGPHKYFVSKNGDNTTGRTWATAWNEMDQIRWASINTMQGDSLTIDGGVGRMIYRKPLSVQAGPSSHYPLRVAVSTESQHNGQAVIAPGSDAIGINVSTGAIQLNGSKRSGIFVYGAKRGISVTASVPYPSNIKNIEVSHCTEAGVYVGPSYYPLPLSQLIVHDNATNVVSVHNGTPGGASLSKCWIYNSTAKVNSDGVRLDGTTSAPSPAIAISNCVLGPGLRDGLNNTTAAATPSLTNCLLINASRNNVSSYSVKLQNVTSFMTRLNASQMSHNCIKLQASTTGYPYQMGSTVKQSIAFGGQVSIPLTVPSPYHTYPPAPPIPFPITVEGNTQFRTTGNTTVLAPTMANPQFVTPVALLPNQTPIPLLMSLDFSLRPDSPAAGAGSAITSVKKLLNSFE